MIDKLAVMANETEKDYKKRLYLSKELYNLTWNDIADLVNGQYGYNYSPDKYRKEARNLIMSEIYEPEPVEASNILWEAKKEKIKATDERVQANAVARMVARDEVFREIALESVKEMSKEKILDVPEAIKVDIVNRKGILCVGDWHYGLDVDLYFNKYSPDIAKDRVNRLTRRVLSIVEEQDLKELIVINLGDMISGRIHLPLRLNSRIDAVTQTIHVSEILAEMLTEFSKRVKVAYISVEDNHSRVEPNKKESINTETFSRIIDWYLQERLSRNPNIDFLDNVFGPDIALFDVYGFTVAAVHGDRDPQKGIVDKLNSYLQTHVDLIISAHMHHFSADENNFTEFYCNGSLIGQDQFAADLRLLSKPSQLMFICTPENVSSVLYKIKL